MRTKKQAWLEETQATPKNTRNSKKSGLKIFKEFSLKVAANESLGFDYEKVERRSSRFKCRHHANVPSVFKLLVGEVRGRNMKSFRLLLPSKITVVCGINRHVCVNCEDKETCQQRTTKGL